MRLLKVLFILKFLYMVICTKDEIFDNSALTLAADENVTSCMFAKTEHFVLKSMDTSARMHLSTEKLFHTILQNMKSLAMIEPKSISMINNHWYTENSFKNIFRYSQSEEDDFSRSTHICTQHLYLKNGNSSV